MVEPQSFDLRSLRSDTRDRREAMFPLSNQLTATVTVDMVKSFAMVESTAAGLTASRTNKLAKVVNEKNLTDPAGGYIYKDNQLHYRTSTLFAKGEFPEEVIRQMLALHQSREVRANLEQIKQESQQS